MKKLECVLCLPFIITLLCLDLCSANRVLLKDVQALTLKEGAYTQGRRSSGVPQLSCVGGSASNKFTPRVVQCYNRGFDGRDVQWECKTDMDDDYRFGEIMVTCEGYDYPDDPYILAGSCGLEYTLDYTKAGQTRNSQSGGSYGGGYNSFSDSYGSEKTGKFNDFLTLMVVIFIIYVVYVNCIRTPTNADGSVGGSGGGGWGGGSDDHRGAPPPPGFRPNNAPPPYSEKDYAQQQGANPNAPPPNNGNNQNNNNNPFGGFWTGLGAGGLMGYLFGNRGGGGYGGYQGRRPGYGWNHNQYYGQGPSTGGWGAFGGGGGGRPFGGGGGGGGFSGGGGASTSGTSRTASGFGGTRRR